MDAKNNQCNKKFRLCVQLTSIAKKYSHYVKFTVKLRVYESNRVNDGIKHVVATEPELKKYELRIYLTQRKIVLTLTYIPILSNFLYLPHTIDFSLRLWPVMREESASMAVSYAGESFRTSESCPLSILLSVVSVT